MRPASSAIFECFDQFRRNTLPERVRFATQNYKYRSAYWVQLDDVSPGTSAEIDARMTGQRQISVRTKNVAGFSLRRPLPTLADTQVRSTDLESANLVLFGTPETNALIARYAAQLPMALNTLFRGSLENVVSEGFFTPEWRLPAETAQKMRASAAVQIQ